MDKFNEDLVAKEAIAASPDITQGVEISLEETPEQAVISNEQAVNSEPNAWDKRNARLLTKGLRNLSDDLDGDRLDAIEDLSAEGFSILTALNVPKAVKIGITAALVAIPFIPAALSVCDSFKNSKQGGHDAS
jgi:hypothetical protein